MNFIQDIYTSFQVTRREMLSAVLGMGITQTAWGAAIGNNSLAVENKELVIEWNAHIFSADIQRFPFHPNAVYKPDPSKFSLDPLEVYIKRLKDENIDKAVIVHPEPYGDDHSLILECLKKEPKRLRGTSLFYPKDPLAPQKLDKLVKSNANMVAVRFHAHRGKESYLDSFADAGVRALWKKAVDLNQIIELHIGPDYAKQVHQTMKAFPDSKVLIDHLAEPHMGTGVEFADVLELAKFPSVYMKLSGIGHFATDAPTYESSLAFTSRVIKEFGPDRMVWGSGTPAIVDVHMAEYSQADRAKVKGGNIRRLLNWTV